jgi:hypothetical protein
MQVVAQPSGRCESFRCRFHGWTYDLQGKFLQAPSPVAPKAGNVADLHLAALATTLASGLVFFSLEKPVGTLGTPELGGPLPDYGGTLVTEVACNWKVLVEHLLAEQVPSGDFIWTWPVLAVRRAGARAIVQQVVPHTFLRTRLCTHVFGDEADAHKQAAVTIKHVCELLQADRAAGAPPPEGALVEAFHSRLAQVYATT